MCWEAICLLLRLTLGCPAALSGVYPPKSLQWESSLFSSWNQGFNARLSSMAQGLSFGKRFAGGADRVSTLDCWSIRTWLPDNSYLFSCSFYNCWDFSFNWNRKVWSSKNNARVIDLKVWSPTQRELNHRGLDLLGFALLVFAVMVEIRQETTEALDVYTSGSCNGWS